MANSRLTDLINQLKRRRVFQVTSVYLVAAWTISLGAAELFPAFGVAEWVIRFLVVGLLLLLPVVIGLAWYFEVTANGIIRDPQDRNPFASPFATKPDDDIPAVQVSWSTEQGPHVATFTNRFRIGRDIGCDISTLDPLASRHHAEVEYRNGDWWIRDLDSRNGTYLEGQRIRTTKLSSKAIIRLGEHGQEVQLQVFGRSTTTVIGAQVDSSGARPRSG